MENKMLLKEYLDQEKMSIEEFAKEAQISKASIYNAISGKGALTWPILNSIMAASHWHVHFADLAPKEYRKKPTKKV
jgi:predicted transcriptional regulator